MASDGSRSIGIIIATIGVVGVLGSAVISNWDKLFPKAATQNEEIRPEQQKAVSGVPADQTVVKQNSTPSPNSENQDSVQVQAITPSTNDVLPRQQLRLA